MHHCSQYFISSDKITDEAIPSATETSNTATSNTVKNVANPKTGTDTNMIYDICIMALIVSVIVITKKKLINK